MRTALVVAGAWLLTSACGPSIPAGTSDAPAAAPAPSSPASSEKAKPKGRLFSSLDLGLLEGPDRDQWQKPEQIMDLLKIADGSMVAEVGAAGGWFTIKLARRVGPNGRVYAEDIQPPMIEAIKRRMQRENLTNVQPILGTTSDPRLPPGLDAVLISGTYHEMDDPVGLLKNVVRSMKPQGRIGVVDFFPGGGGPGPESDQRVDPATVITGATGAGLQLVSRETIPPFVYLLIFQPTPAPRATRQGSP